MYEPNIIHYVYVKDAFRNYGIATKLLENMQSPFQASHLTYSLLDLWTAKKIKCDFNPYILSTLWLPTNPKRKNVNTTDKNADF